MDGRTEIRDANGALLAYKIPEVLQKGLCPYSDESDFVQALSWNYDAGKRLQPHRHLSVPRVVEYTQEVVVVLRGRLRATVFDSDCSRVTELLLGPGETAVFLAGGHGYEIMEDDTRVLEIKNGPYPGAELDRERFDP